MKRVASASIINFFSKKRKEDLPSEQRICVDQENQNSNPINGDNDFSANVQTVSTKSPRNSTTFDPVCDLPRHRLEKEDIVKGGPCQPVLSSYPKILIGSKLRSFRSDWFRDFKWLEYSKRRDAAFCFCCRIFGLDSTGGKGQLDKAFTQKGFRSWNNASTSFRSHQQTKSHLHCLDV